MFFSKKASVDITVGLMVTISLALIMLAISFFFLKGGVDLVEQGTSCEGLGHVLASSCDELSSVRNNLFSEDKEGLVCCMEKPGKLAEFNEWKQTIIDNPLSGKDVFEEGDNKDISFKDSSISGNNHLLASDETPDYGYGETKNKPEYMIDKGNSYLRVNGELLKNHDTAMVYSNSKISFSAKNNFEETPSTCSLILYKQEINSDLETYDQVDSYSYENCKIHNELKFTTQIESGIYKIKFMITVGDQTKTADYAFVETNDIDQPSSANELKLSRTIKIKEEEAVYRGNEEYLFLYSDFTGPENDEINKWVYLENTGGTCGNKDSFGRKYAYTEILIPEGKQACVLYDIFETDDYKEATSEVKIISGVDKLILLDNDEYNTYFNDCSFTCEFYSSNSDACKDYTARQTSCQYSLDCFWSDKDDEHSKRFCDSCDEINVCSDFNTKSGCEENQCILGPCKWDSALFGGKCINEN